MQAALGFADHWPSDLAKTRLQEGINLFVGLRVTRDIEREGLDLALHGEVVQ